MLQTKVAENTKQAFYFINDFKIRAVYEIMWNGTDEPDRPQMTIWRMRIAYSIT